jgi:hypothetical protein
MSFSKLKRLHVMILGALLCVITGVGFFFLLISPVMREKAQTQAEYEASKAIADQLPMATQDFNAAKQEVSAAEGQFAAYEQSKMPNLSFAQRDQGMIDLWREQVEVLGPLLIRSASRGGVRLESQISISAPPTNPNEVPTDLIKIPIGKVTVVGDFASILRNLRAWNSCPRLVQIDKPSISGASPYLTADYDVTVYIFPKGAAGPQIQMAGASTGTSAVVPTPGTAPTASGDRSPSNDRNRSR